MAAKRNGKKDRIVGAQFTDAVIKQIEDFRLKMAKAFPGAQPTTSDAVRALVERGLSAGD